MQNHHLRTTILKLLDHLSDHDRQRLHFFLTEHVPRRIRDDPSFLGTLNLMESLFDQDKISEQNFGLLINAFSAIKCVEGLKILKELKRQMHSSSSNGAHWTPEIPLNVQIIEDQEKDEEDKSASHILLPEETRDGQRNKMKDTNLNLMTSSVDTKQEMSLYLGDEQPFYISFKMNKYFFFITLLLSLGFGIVLTIFLVTHNRAKGETLLKEERNLKNEIQLLKNLLSEKDENISRLGNRIGVLEKEKVVSDQLPIKPGQKFGGTDVNIFDDSSSSDFTCAHYLMGLIARADDEDLETYQFFYSSPRAKGQKIRSPFHGNEKFRQLYTHEFFNADEKIISVEGVIVNKTILSDNGANLTKSIITGLRFLSTEDHENPVLSDSSGITFNESFDGYTLGYVAGRAGDYIEQLQFFWYKIQS